MNGEIICVGTELLRGDIVNTHAQYLSTELGAMGINVCNQVVVGDNKEDLSKVLNTALKRSDIIILTGGLGPTPDDITKETVGEVLGLSTETNSDILYEIINYYVLRKREVPKGIEKQAIVLKDAEILKNDVGTAPGFFIEKNDKYILLLPGPKNEMVPMMENYAKKLLEPKCKDAIVSRILHIYGMGESEIVAALGNMIEGDNPIVATYAKTGEVAVRITSFGKSKDLAEKNAETAVKRIKKLFENKVYTDEGLPLNEVAVKVLLEKGIKVATAESCTAGMLSKSITDISGASEVFEMGVSAYSNDIKVNALNVPKEIIDEFGAVSPETAVYMAEGIRKLSGANIGIGITGVAGPESQEGKPVGLVYIGMADEQNLWVRKLSASGNNDRDSVRKQATLAALDMMRRYAEVSPKELGSGFKLGEEPIVCLYPDDFSPVSTIKKGIETLKQITDTALLDTENSLFIQELEEDILPPDSSSDEQTAGALDELMGTVMNAKEIRPKNLNGYYDHGNYDSGDFITDEEEISFLKETKKIIAQKKWIILAVALITAAAIIISSLYVFKLANANEAHLDTLTRMRNSYDITSVAKEEDGFPKRFSYLLEQNEDIKGWVRIDGTGIDYPFYQRKDNEYYEDHDMLGTYNKQGAIFADKGAKITERKLSQNIALQGNNLEDGTMFSDLTKYKRLSFYKNNPLINFDTIYSKAESYKVFAVFVTNSDKKQDDGNKFNYKQNLFPNESNFNYFIENVMARSVITTNIDVAYTDSIITLATSSDEFEGAMTVVMARKVRQGESLHVSTADAKESEKPLYPQAYYDKNGGEKPEVNISYYVGDMGNKTESNKNNTTNKTEEKLTAEVPSLVGETLTDAIKKINNAGLYISDIEYKISNTMNVVVSQGITAGTKVEENSGIKLTVRGNEYSTNVPDFEGLSTNGAIQLANRYLLTMKLTKKLSEKEKGTVLSQDIKAESSTKERTIGLTVASGENKVPDVLGKTSAKAKKALEKAGFQVKMAQIEIDDEDEVGKVLSQNVQAKKIHSLEEPITIYIGIQKEDEKEKDDEKETSSESESSSKKSSSSKKTNSSKKSNSSKSESSASSKVNSSKEESKKGETSSTTSSAVSSLATSSENDSTSSNTTTNAS